MTGLPGGRGGRIALGVLLILALVLAPQVVYVTFLMKLMCFALFACAFNLVGGYAGLLSFGHAMYFGGAAYVYAWLAKEQGWPFELAMLLAVAVTTIFGLATGALAIRRSGIQFGMATLALAQMFYFLCVQLPQTGGEDGIQGVPRTPLFGLFDVADDRRFYFVILLLFLAGFAGLWRIIRSPFGDALAAIRDNEPRAVSLGCDVARYKLLAFVLSAAFSALAGAMFAATLGFASLNGVQWHLSGEVIMMSLIGGIATIFGPLVGAAVLLVMQGYLAGLGQYVLVTQGAVFVVVVIFFPRGIIGELLALRRRTARANPEIVK